MNKFETIRGRGLLVVGDESLLTPDRLALISSHMDADPRVATVSVVAIPSHGYSETILRATSPTGPVAVFAEDLVDIVGPLPTDPLNLDNLREWASAASERGLWHDLLIAMEPDVARAPLVLSRAFVDANERQDPTSAQHAAFSDAMWSPGAMTVTVDATWLGPHETGAQVLATAAIEALALQNDIAAIDLVGVTSLPTYAQHLENLQKVSLGRRNDAPPADIVWYPNQIDARSNFGIARALGTRVVVTYLDLIAYDIPRYHSSEGSWQAYRALQRVVALSVDGITTISADVADRLRREVPGLESCRVQPILLGLDHIVRDEPEVGQDISELVAAVSGRPFVLVLGNDFVHKNRDFAIRVWEEVLNRGIGCDLVLAGLHVRSSSGGESERSLLLTHTNLRGRYHTVGHVSSGSRAWLLKYAAAVLYPSSAEGFGFVPYEAAAMGTPTTFTSFGPLREVSRLTSVPQNWTVEAYADDLGRLLTDEGAAQERVEELKKSLERHTWDAFARELSDFFSRIRTLPLASPVWPLADIDEKRTAAILTFPERVLRVMRRAKHRITQSRD